MYLAALIKKEKRKREEKEERNKEKRRERGEGKRKKRRGERGEEREEEKRREGTTRLSYPTLGVSKRSSGSNVKVCSSSSDTLCIVELRKATKKQGKL